MSDLTPTQFTMYRMMLGDMDELGGELSNPIIQQAYDDALAQGEDANTTQALTMVTLLRLLWGLALNKIDVSGEVERERRNPIFDRIKKMLDKYEGLAGIGGAGVMSTGEIGLGIDFTQDDIDSGAGLWPL